MFHFKINPPPLPKRDLRHWLHVTCSKKYTLICPFKSQEHKVKGILYIILFTQKMSVQAHVRMSVDVYFDVGM